MYFSRFYVVSYKNSNKPISHKKLLGFTVWKFGNFPATLILREISRSKTAILSILEALTYEFWEFLHVKVSKISKSSKFRADNVVKMTVFGSYMTKIGFT